MKIIKLNSNQPKRLLNNQLSEITTTLKNGGLVIYPTETVYGVGVDATNPKAVEKLLKYKSRREGKPLSIAVTDLEMAEKYVELTNQAKKMYQNFLPGPYTIVSKGRDEVASGVESEFGTLGIRIPDYSLVVQIIQTLGKPITATSANSSGKKRPYTIQDIFDNLSEKQKTLIDLVIDVGELPKNNPSTVIDTTLTTPLMMRGGDQKNSSQDFSQKLTTNSPAETQDLAGKILLKHWDQIKKTGLIIGLDGKLGAGKTIFTKGLAKFLKIKEVITSPTYLYHLEYPYNRHEIAGFLHHLDVWKIDSKTSFKLLETEKLIKPGNVVVIEWWQQIADFWEESQTLVKKNQAPIIEISLKETKTSKEKNNNQRNIFIK